MANSARFENMTPAGRQEYRLYDSYGLGAYYVIETGNCIIPEDEMRNAFRDVVSFMQDHPDYFCGYEDEFGEEFSGRPGGYFYVSSWEN